MERDIGTGGWEKMTMAVKDESVDQISIPLVSVLTVL